MKILLIGHLGMLGHDLHSLLSQGNKVVGKDIDTLDITNELHCKKVISQVKPELIINAAAYTAVDLAEKEKEKCFAVNANGVLNLVKACPEEVKFVHFSTDYVFDGQQISPYFETDFCNPINVYGKSKLVGENHIYGHKKNHPVIRTAWLYGKNGKNFVTTILNKVKKGERLSVVMDQIGSPTYTKDLAEATKCLIEKNCIGTYHVTNSGFCSWHTFALESIAAAKFSYVVNPVKAIDLKQAAARPEIVVLNRNKFRKDTGHELRHWKQAVNEFITKELKYGTN
jgi:dTDP-4-dehydrorhamnose reductase